MDAVFLAAAVFALVLAFIMTVVAVRLLRESRDRSTARVAALQAAVEAIEDHQIAPSPVGAPLVTEDEWDLALSQQQQADAVVAPTALFGAPTAPVAAPAARIATIDAPIELRPAAPRSVESRPVEPRPTRFEIRHDDALEHPLFESTVPAAPSRRWQWMAATALVIAAGAGTFYAVSTGFIGRVSAADGPKPAAAPSAAAPIELLSLRNATDAGQFVVTGLVQNPATGASMRDVFAVVYLFDADGKYFASGRAALQSAVLSPGGEAAFVVKVPATMTVSRYRVSFQQQDGAGVVHVDRRGTLPEGTTGDTIDPPAAPAPAPSSAPPASGRKNR